jgi:AcrR family transcriptional regulator
VTRDKILDAAAQEIELNGLTQFRVKRVASAAGTSVALLYSYFDDREGLIAAAIVHRFRQVLLAQADVDSTAQLRDGLTRVIAEAQAPDLSRARLARVESMSFAEHNLAASTGIEAAKREVSELIYDRVKPLEARGLLAPGVSAIAFARIWYALFFGQIALEGEHALSIPRDEWLVALSRLAQAVVAD